jgi:tRNA A37 threonylcarbamoyltransferase TsaD
VELPEKVVSLLVEVASEALRHAAEAECRARSLEFLLVSKGVATDDELRATLQRFQHLRSTSNRLRRRVRGILGQEDEDN